MNDLFSKMPAEKSQPQRVLEGKRPLAERLRPQSLDEVIGQDHLLGKDGPLTAMLSNNSLLSIIFWGPPGVGKTTLARLLAAQTALCFTQISAVFSGVSDLKKIFEAAQIRWQNGQRTLLFVDEIHRFNKAQQDSFLPLMEEGVLALVGATTENPSFELNAALLSRAQVLTLKALDRDALDALLVRAEEHEGQKLPLMPDARAALITMGDGDGRTVLNLAEQIFAWQSTEKVTEVVLRKRLTQRAAKYDKSGDSHYNLISALHKSVRGSDPDAALYWFTRMLEGGEDPRYLARRITRMAVEDIGLADPEAATNCLNAWQIYERLGSPEGELALAQAVIYLALAPKSNAAYVAFKSARADARNTGSVPPPKHILNAPTGLMKEEGYGANYQYDHDAEDGFSGQNYFPENMARGNYYAPTNFGFEREMKARLEYFVKLRKKRQTEAVIRKKQPTQQHKKGTAK